MQRGVFGKTQINHHKARWWSGDDLMCLSHPRTPIYTKVFQVIDLNQSSKSTFNRMAEKQKSQGVVQWPSQNPDLNKLKQVCKESNFLHDARY